MRGTDPVKSTVKKPTASRAIPREREKYSSRTMSVQHRPRLSLDTTSRSADTAKRKRDIPLGSLTCGESIVTMSVGVAINGTA